VSPDLRPLIDRIRARAGACGTWELGSGEVASLLGIDGTELCRRVYAASLERRAVLDLSAATGTFGPDTVSELLAVLELFYGREAERELERAGLFFPHDRRVDIQEVFLSVAARRLASHVPEEAKFSAMLRALGRFEAARDAYLRELPTTDELVRESAAAYCRSRSFGIPELAAGAVEATLRLFLRRKVLSLDAVLGPLVERLRAQALREGYLRERPRAEAEGEPGERRAARAERERAQAVLELQGHRLTAELLRRQYRRLMKRFHPDVNPSGLERAKQINAAYALLVVAVGA
jgi:hypothetical protein